MAALAFFPDIERLHVQHDGGVSFLDDMVCGCIGIEDDEPEYVFPQDGKNKEKADEEDGQGKHQRGPAFDDMIGKKANGNGINGDEKSYETCEQCENVDCPQKARGVVNDDVHPLHIPVDNAFLTTDGCGQCVFYNIGGVPCAEEAVREHVMEIESFHDGIDCPTADDSETGIVWGDFIFDYMAENLAEDE